ncbi:MAG TPA: Uma2 family endonuclease [Thermomicrobiales bacterium]|nr:Uma2 family endonuclease [Thermomicrobiales bacterium]
MVGAPWRQPPLTRQQEIDLFMVMLEDDTEDAPWMVMGDLQFWSASGFAHSLRVYARERGLGWYVASMLPIEYTWPPSSRRRVLAPDVFVAFAAQHSRPSFDAEAEGFPPFVLEVVSPSSTTRDQQEKRLAYEMLGVREYALFTPREGTPSALQGYRRGADGQFAPWAADEQGRLWSEVLGLYLVTRGALLQAQTSEGRLLPTPEETAAALRDAEEARRRAEAEAEQLRRELERYRGRDHR